MNHTRIPDPSSDEIEDLLRRATRVLTRPDEKAFRLDLTYNEYVMVLRKMREVTHEGYKGYTGDVMDILSKAIWTRPEIMDAQEAAAWSGYHKVLHALRRVVARKEVEQ